MGFIFIFFCLILFIIITDIIIIKNMNINTREYLLSYKEQGKTILICSHSAEDIEVLCDTVHEMDKGVLEP